MRGKKDKRTENKQPKFWKNSQSYRRKMALARLALRNLHRRVSTSSPSLVNLHNLGEGSASAIGGVQRQKWSNELLKRFMATAANDEKKQEKEVAVTEKKSRLFPRRRGRRGSLWRNNEIPQLSGNTFFLSFVCSKFYFSYCKWVLICLRYCLL